MPLTEDSLSLLSKTELAYIAGIIDGEGSISLVPSKLKRANGRSIFPLVRIANTNFGLIDWLGHRLAGGRHYTDQVSERRKPVAHIGWASNEAVLLLKAVLPYLVIKKPHAELVIELWAINESARWDAGGYFGNGHPIPDWLLYRRLDAKEKLAVLNKRGL